MAQYAIIVHGYVLQIVEWDGDPESWQPPPLPFATLPLEEGIVVGDIAAVSGTSVQYYHLLREPPYFPSFDLLSTLYANGTLSNEEAAYLVSKVMS